MKNDLILLTYEQGNLLIRLLIAHFASDFIFHNQNLIQNNKWLSKQFLIHTAIVFTITLVLSKSFYISILITTAHLLIDELEIKLLTKIKGRGSRFFYLNQILQLISLVVIWAFNFNVGFELFEAISVQFLDYKTSLIILAYIFVIYPVSFMIKLLTYKMGLTMYADNSQAGSIEILDGGKLIGQFERIIILTFVLISHYEAIGFLITGKSIIRFAEKDSKLRSEYVLVGTMMSYAFAIITGVLFNKMICVQTTRF